ncbi:MAG: biotin/lipoyl-binding protein [Alphaproteobacteria bacterium]|nr:biotin/lipoyl-binding protein [Alphaproteobacteria bacterium]
MPDVDPAEPAPPLEKPAPPPPEPTPKPDPTGAHSYRRRVLLVLSSVVLALGLYWASGYFFAYTDDAYVTSDFVNVAPYISGRIVSVNVVDNQAVQKGQLLATIDDTISARIERKAGKKN